jgi:hypothetical protein
VTPSDISPRRWLRPPRLRTVEAGAGDRHASRLELFFDLVLVVAIAQLAHLFAHHPELVTYEGVTCRPVATGAEHANPAREAS